MTAADVTLGRGTDSGWFRRVLGQYPTGVTAVTAIGGDGSPVGMAIGSFTSVSLDPPLVAFLPDKKSSTWPRIQSAGKFCVNILAADQEPVCRAFATRGADKFADVTWRPGATGSPILHGAVAWIDCDLETIHDAGDHLIVIGRVTDLDVERPELPLLFFQGGYGRFSPHSLAIRDTRFALQLHLLDRARPLMEDVSDRTGARVVASYCDGNELTPLASVGAPSDLRASSATIGERVPVVAPVGIWWMAFAPGASIDTWLRGVEPPELKARYRQALTEIRKRGYCLGLESVHTRVEELISRRPGRGAEPTHQERQHIGDLALDPLDFVPSDQAAPSSGAVVSLWAPTFTAEGDVPLGLMLAVPPDGNQSAPIYAGALLALARDVTSLGAS